MVLFLAVEGIDETIVVKILHRSHPYARWLLRNPSLTLIPHHSSASQVDRLLASFAGLYALLKE
jgi:hypothetical protein